MALKGKPHLVTACSSCNLSLDLAGFTMVDLEARAMGPGPCFASPVPAWAAS